jgi:hypothetical protein
MSGPRFGKRHVVGLIAGALVATAVTAVVVHARAATRAAASREKGEGRQLTWAVTLQARMQQPNGPLGSNDSKTTVKGELVATVSAVSEAGVEIAYELRHPQFEGVGFGDVSAADRAAVEQKLTPRFWVTHQADGAARALHFPREMATDVRNLLALIVTEMQLVRPAQPSPQWTATERDGAGTYLVSYVQPAPREITKRKLRYLAADGAGASAALDVKIDAAEARFGLDAEGRVAEATVHDRVRLAAGFGAGDLIADMQLAVSNLRVGEAAELVGSRARAGAAVETTAVVTQAGDPAVLQARQDERLIKDVTLAQLLAAMRAGEVEPKTRFQLGALFRQRPTEIPAALTAARAEAPAVGKPLVEALGDAGSPAAQDGLGRLAVDAQVPEPLRLTAISAVAQNRRPAPGTIAWLKGLLDAPEARVKKQATLVMGALGRSLFEVDVEAGARVEADLLRRYRACRGTACDDLLIGLGNLGTAGVEPAVAEALRDPSASVRARAVQSLRRMNHPDVDRLIATTMASDSDPTVRSAAVDAAFSRPLGPFVEPLSVLVRADRVPHVRIHAIQAMADHLDTAPQLQQALVAVATADPNPGVQRSAREALGRRFTKGH